MRMQQWEGRRRFRENKLARTVRGCFAQDDQSVANAAGSVVRADINANLQALVTNSSGTSAPSTTWAYQFWADTTNGLMKQRNAANSAWITLWNLAGGFDSLDIGGGYGSSGVTISSAGAISADGTVTGGTLKSGSRTTILGNTIFDPTSGGNDCGIGFGGGATLLPVDGAGNAVNGTLNLGSATYRWNTIYATNGTINTSDARGKTAVRPLTGSEIAASKDLAQEIGAFKFLAAIEAKGDQARSHIGMTVQRAIEIMQSRGLDPFAYGFICYDRWDSGVDGTIVTEAGDSYGFRVDELLLFVARGFEQRLAALEASHD